MKKTFVSVLVALALMVSTGLAFAGEYSVYGKVESFTWKEYDGSSQILKESGPLYGLGVSSAFTPISQLKVRGKAEILGGQIDYEGQTQAGAPASTNVNHVAVRAEGTVGWQFPVDSGFAIEPSLGLGYRWWIRDINDSDTALGYVERWRSLYARAGVRGDYNYNISKGFTVFAEAGAKLPVYNSMTAELSKFGLSDIDLKPGKKASAFATVGVRYSVFTASVFYEGMRFSKSPAVDISSGLVAFQPESKADTYGINIGVAF